MEDILELAEKLGEAISADPRYKALAAIEEQISRDESIKKLLDEYHAQQSKIAELERSVKPIEPEDKRRLQELQEKVIGTDLIKKMSAARFEYANLMRQVDEAIQSKLGPSD